MRSWDKAVTVVIPNFNGQAYLEPCLDSLRLQSIGKVPVLVVDNGSTDGSLKLLKGEYPEVELISLDQNYGFCKAVNIGIKAVRTPYVILLNNDTLADPYFVEELVKAIRASKQTFSCQAKMLSLAHREEIDDAGDLYNAFGWAFARGRGKDDHLFEEPTPIFASCGGAAIYRRDLVEKLGYFDERHFAYLEDIDIGYRARLWGYVNRYVPTARVYHAGSATTGSKYNQTKAVLVPRNSIYMAYKNMPPLQLFLNLPFLLAGILLKLLFFTWKGLGKEHLQGLKEGIAMCKPQYRVKFSLHRLPFYVRIQFELWRNLFYSTF